MPLGSVRCSIQPSICDHPNGAKFRIEEGLEILVAERCSFRMIMDERCVNEPVTLIADMPPVSPLFSDEVAFWIKHPRVFNRLSI